MFCNKCGASIPEDSQFCHKCGKAQDIANTVQSETLLKRAQILLQEGELGRADDLCERVLDMEPENAQAYVIKLMIRAQVKEEEDLARAEQSYAQWNSYQSACRFADDALRDKLEGYLRQTEEAIRLKEREEQERQEEQRRLREEQRKNRVYTEARRLSGEHAQIVDLTKAIQLFKTILQYRDAENQLQQCNQRLDELKKEQEQQRLEQLKKQKKKKKCIAAVALVLVVALIAGIILIVNGVQTSCSERADRIEQMLRGAYFVGHDTSYNTGSSNDQFKPVTSISEETITIYFEKTGEVKITTASKVSKGNYVVKDGQTIRDVISSDTHTRIAPDYYVYVSLGGDVTVTVDGNKYVLNVDANDRPVSMERNGVTYKRSGS